MLGDAESALQFAGILFAAALGGTLMLVAWRRFTVLLTRAEQFGELATCKQCNAWGKFRVLGQERALDDDPPEAGKPRWLRVCCTRCGNQWRLG